MKRKRKTRSEGKKTPSLLPRTLAAGKKRGGAVGLMPGPHGTERVTITDPDGHWRSMRRAVDTIDVMFKRRQIDSRQLEAAELYRKTEEVLRGTIPCTLDMTRARGGIGATPTQTKMVASEIMEAAATLLGKMDSRIVSAVATDGHSIDSAARMLYPVNSNGKQARWVAEHVGRRFREALTTLADAWFAKPGKPRINGARMFDKGEMVNTPGTVERGKVAHSDRLDDVPQPRAGKLPA